MVGEKIESVFLAARAPDLACRPVSEAVAMHRVAGMILLPRLHVPGDTNQDGVLGMPRCLGGGRGGDVLQGHE